MIIAAMRRGVVIGVAFIACTSSVRENVQDASMEASSVDALTARCDPQRPFGPPSIVPGLQPRDWSLRLTADGLTGFFSSEVRDAGPGGHDLFLAARATQTSPFGPAVELTTINTSGYETEPSITGNGLAIYFTSARGGNDDLYVATRPAAMSAFGNAMTIQELNTSASEHTPYVREDGKALYFTRQNEIYRAAWNGAAFEPPTPVAELNSPYLDFFPTITPDDRTIYFSSGRPTTASGENIWMAQRASSNEPFGPAKLVAELSSDSEDAPNYVTADGCDVYFHSDRGGRYEIYVARRLK